MPEDTTWQAPIVELSRDMSAYLLWLVAADLGRWTPERRSRLQREEAVGLSLFLQDQLPASMRSEIPEACAAD